MRAILLVLTAAAVLPQTAPQPGPGPSSAMRPPQVAQLAWMQGCWALERDGAVTEEQWLSPRASSMLGVSRTTRGSTLVEYELVLIRERGDGLSYEAHPSNQEPAVFMSTRIGERSIEFENLAHDFPQRVGYDGAAPDRLLAWIEGSQDAGLRRIEFPYRRVPCAGE